MHLLTGLFLLLAGPLWAAEMVRVQLDFIETTAGNLPRVTEHRTPYSFLLKEIEQKRASRYNIELLIARSGETATTESILEMIYRSDYDPPGSERWRDYLRQNRPDFTRLFYRPPTPTMFETRNTGFTLEVQPVITTNNFIDLRLAADEVSLQRIEVVIPYEDHYGNADIKMPVFESHRQNLGLTLLANRPQLFAIYSPRRDDGSADPVRRILLFLTASLLEVRSPS
ncbi:hypothetical protein [Roseibacillus persicicus]|uniref:hypothetical protein n=1 Tax=Roseibacillus persicicus TaxID=454148 RepID=UPI00280D33D2|nr:hypothetical protein [Roseibacillus persicicus]MDQ8189156.1 hypothetical protein [Roseibacillus persicicus]